ncbi:MAG: hypothetical protein DRH24_02475 [Deltaproteobacteria bacterium]|nr:MAG: hypothetical protein DRH24_02475 [Deltaproteobacteria bacterium]
MASFICQFTLLPACRRQGCCFSPGFHALWVGTKKRETLRLQTTFCSLLKPVCSRQGRRYYFVVVIVSLPRKAMTKRWPRVNALKAITFQIEKILSRTSGSGKRSCLQTGFFKDAGLLWLKRKKKIA